MEAVAIPGEVSDLSDACLVDLLQMAPTADVLENLRDEDPERGFGAKAQAALLRCLRHPLVVAHPPGRPYRERLLKLAALAAERDGLAVDDGLAEAHAEALCEPRTSDQWCHKTFVLDVDPTPPRDVGTSSRRRGANPDPPARAMSSPALITARVSPNLFEGGTGCHEWAAGFALAELVVSHARRFAGKRVVELGPGVGVASSTLAKTPRPPLEALTLLDRDNETLANLAANLALNGVRCRIPDERAKPERNAPTTALLPVRQTEDRDAGSPCVVSLRRLDWHDFDPARLRSIRADVVVAADVLYDPLDVPALLDVAAALLGERRDEEGTTFFRRGDGGDAPREDEKKKDLFRAARRRALRAFRVCSAATGDARALRAARRRARVRAGGRHRDARCGAGGGVQAARRGAARGDSRARAETAEVESSVIS